MDQLVLWVQGNWSELLVIVLAAYKILEVVAKWTKTDLDDKIVAALKGVIEKLVLKKV